MQLNREEKRHANAIFTKAQKKLAKAKHILAGVNNPVLFEENRIALATEIVTSASKRAPLWGGFRFKHDGMTYHFKK